jgi:hypothetical protein
MVIQMASHQSGLSPLDYFLPYKWNYLYDSEALKNTLEQFMDFDSSIAKVNWRLIVLPLVQVRVKIILTLVRVSRIVPISTRN